MKCLKCGTPYSPMDILVLEEDELPVCDLCSLKEHHFLVNYDGSSDLFEFLGKEVNKQRCKECMRGFYDLDSIVYGTPVEASVICSRCKANHTMGIFIKFV